MEIENNIRREVYSQATPSQRFLYGSFETAKKLSALVKKYQLSEEVSSVFINTIGDIILGFYKSEDTVPLLQQELGLDAKTAALLGADVLDFLAPLSDPNWQPPVEVDEDGSNDLVLSTSASTLQSESYTAQPATPTEIPELRTMAADMVEVRSAARATFNAALALDDEPVYSSTQPTLERPAPEAPSYAAPLYQPPKPNVDAPLEKPRWG